MNLNEMISKFRVARFAYMVGYSFISDYEYQQLKDKIEQLAPDTKELHQIYEEDTIDRNELLSHGIPELVINEYLSNKVSEELPAEVIDLLKDSNKSIISYNEFDQVYDAIKSMGKGTFIFSPKIDGIFNSAIYRKIDDNHYTLYRTFSRGRASDVVDTTVNCKHVIPNTITVDGITEQYVRVNFEIVMKKQYLQEYGYTNMRSGAQGLIMSTVNTKIDKLHSLMYFAHGISVGTTHREKYEILSNSGLVCVPITEFTVSDKKDIDTLINLSEQRVKEWSSSNKVDTDGIVIKKDLSNITGEAMQGTKMYDLDVLASKIGFWSEQNQEVEVLDITASQEDAEISYAIHFTPFTASNGNKITKVTNVRLATLVSQDIRPGTKILVSYINSTTPKFIGRA